MIYTNKTMTDHGEIHDYYDDVLNIGLITIDENPLINYKTDIDGNIIESIHADWNLSTKTIVDLIQRAR